jgi:peptidoglycan/LPS O-acetylase OafA/YrhL
MSLPQSNSSTDSSADVGKPRENHAYRREIDGLRAIAIIAVLMFHAGLKCTGGYVGVDVFFVISGFLITGLMLRDMRAGTFSLRVFWERRIRRIVPALAVMILVTLLVGGLIFMPSDSVQMGKSVIAQAVMGANVFFWRDDSVPGGYFAPARDERPLLHTWSLSVEEQFYLGLPLLLMAMFRGKWFRTARNLSAVLLAAVTAGLFISAIEVRNRPEAAFYLLPYRSWELLLGSLVAALPATCFPRRRMVRELASWIGLAAILIPCWFYTRATPFPGLFALPPCLGTALVIYANSRGGSESPDVTSVGRMLSFRPITFVGLISYSLYLWHWPVLVFGHYWVLRPFSPWWVRAGLLAVAFVLAFLSWRFVESPFRRKSLMRTRASAFAFAVTGTVLTIAAGLLLIRNDGFPGRLPEVAVANKFAATDHLNPDEVKVELDGVRKGKVLPLGTGDSGISPKLLLWGDSHAMQLIPAFDALCKEASIKGAAITYPASAPLFKSVYHLLVGTEEVGLGATGPEYADAVLDYIKSQKVQHVVLAARWSIYEKNDGELLRTGLRETIKTLKDAGCVVWVVQGFPDLDASAPRALAAVAFFNEDPITWRRTVDDHARKNAVVYELAKEGGARFLDPAPLLLPADGDRYKADIDGVSLYHDNNHLTRKASLLVALPFFRERMVQVLKGARE